MHVHMWENSLDGTTCIALESIVIASIKYSEHEM